jgi:pimeloyl-ACP methyl ester carboxylesterase
MTVEDQHVRAAAWNEPDGIAVRGTVVVIPGRGEQPALYERFGRRIAADGYRVRAVADPVQDAALTEAQVSGLLADDGSPAPRVLVGSDTGALFAVGLAVSGRASGLSALVLAGLPTAEAPEEAGSWDEELEVRTACPTHRARLSAGDLRRGALYGPVPEGWARRADLGAVEQPVLGIHGAADPISPLATARARYAQAASAELVSIVDGRHDVLNDLTHRTVAATIVLFLERLRLGPALPRIAITETLGHTAE